MRRQGLDRRLGIAAAPVAPEFGIGQRAGVAEREPVVKPRTRSPVQLVGRQLWAQVIAAVVGEPQLARHRVPGETHRVPEAPRVDLDARAVGMHPKDGAVVAFRAAHIARRADRKIEKTVRSELQHLPAVMPVGRQPVGDDHGSGRVAQSRLNLVEAEDGVDRRHVERPVAERDPARHPQPRCDLAHALATTVAVFIGHCEDAPFPAGADEEGAFLPPGHLPCIGDFREGLDDEALREMDGGEAIVPFCSGGAEESGAEQQRQDEGFHDPTHMPDGTISAPAVQEGAAAPSRASSGQTIESRQFPCDSRRPDSITLRPRRWRPGMAELHRTRGGPSLCVGPLDSHVVGLKVLSPKALHRQTVTILSHLPCHVPALADPEVLLYRETMWKLGVSHHTRAAQSL